MSYVFIAFCIVLIIKVLRRPLDFYSIGAICLMIYNVYCSSGIVFISSHEVRNTFYYYSALDFRTYIIVLTQMVILYVTMVLNDKRKDSIVIHDSLIIDDLSEGTKHNTFVIACSIAWAIMIYNIVFKIGISNLFAQKSYIWSQTSGLYVTSNWLGMAVFTYAIRRKEYILALFCAAPVLLHFFFGSRAYFVTIGIIVLLFNGKNIHFNKALFKRIGIIALTVFGSFFVFIYRRVYELIKVGDFSSAFRLFLDPESYSYALRLGEPRIVLANLNYIIQNRIKLGFGDLIDRIIAIIPFANNAFRSGKYTAMSTILRTDMDSSYGLASNFWGESYALGSYVLVVIMFLLWVRLLKWGNELIRRDDWTAAFCTPLVGYLSFYIHRLDFVKAIGNAKMVLMAMILFYLACVLVTRKKTIRFRHRT